MTTPYSRDTFLLPITITSSNNIFCVVEDPGGVPNEVYVTVDAGTYYLHDDSSFHATAKGLLYTIKTLLNDGTTSGLGTRTGTPNKSYAWAALTPTSSTGIAYGGLELTGSGASGDLTLNYAGGTVTTMDGRWFGFASANPGDITSTAGAGLDEEIKSPYCARNRFVTHDLDSDAGYAVNKRRIPYRIDNKSTQRTKNAITLVWEEGYYRTFRYEDVPGGLIFENRSAESAYATIAGLHTNDRNHSWELVWNALADMKSVLVVHNSHTDLSVDSHDYEMIKLESGMAWEDTFFPKQSGADLHDVDFLAWVDPDIASYDH